MINYKRIIREEFLTAQEIIFATGTTDIEILERCDNASARINMQFRRLLCPPNTQILTQNKTPIPHARTIAFLSML